MYADSVGRADFLVTVLVVVFMPSLNRCYLVQAPCIMLNPSVFNPTWYIANTELPEDIRDSILPSYGRIVDFRRHPLHTRLMVQIWRTR